MALHPLFPSSPHAPLDPGHRWFPADEALRESSYDKLLPPLVVKIRQEVYDWRMAGYPGASQTSKALLHHVPKTAWFKSIQDIHHRMLQKDCPLALQVDVTATPRHDSGAIFVQTVSDFPLVEAIHQNVVKHPILPEQTLGRGLRPMFRGSNTRETVSVIATPAFMDFVESIRSEGVLLEYAPMGGGSPGESTVVEIDADNPDKDLDALDIALPKLTRRFHREYKDLDSLDPATLGNKRLPLKAFTSEETREIVFKRMLDDQIDHTIQLDGAGAADYSSVVGFFARQLLKDLRLVGGYDILYPKVKNFIRDHLFTESPVDLVDPLVLRNLSEPEVGKTIYDGFKAAINALTIQDRGSARIEDHIRLRDTRPFNPDGRSFLIPKKSVFNRIVGQPGAEGLELEFASFLEGAPDVAAFAKNYFAIGFKMDYVKADGDISTYTPDFVVRTLDSTIWIVETKGREELDLPQKMARLRLWCEDATAASAAAGGPEYRFVYVDEEGFKKHRPPMFAALVASFREYQE